MGKEIKVKNMTGVYYYLSEKKRHQGKPDKNFYITYNVSGKRKWEKVGALSEGVTAAYASQVRSERVRQLRSNTLPSALQGKDITLDDAWIRFRDTHLILSKNNETVSIEEQRYNKHIKPRFGHMPLSRITPFDLEEFKTSLLRQYAPQSASHIIGLIRRTYAKHIEWKLWTGTPPTTNITIKKADNGRYRYLTVKEAYDLLDTLRPARSDFGGSTGSAQTYNMTLLALHTGMRFKEIANLRGEHINLATKSLRISESKNYKGRTLYLTNETIEMLSTLPLTAGELVFPGRNGVMKRISQGYPNAVERIGLNKGVKDARDKVVFHTLRHTFASWLAIEGVSLYGIADMLGHSSLEMVKRYAHLCPDVYKQAVSKLEEMISTQKSSSL